MYAYELADSKCDSDVCECGKKCKGECKCKGVKDSVVKKHMTLSRYKDCLFNEKTYYAKFNIIRSRKHNITTECVTKVVLSARDDKRWIIPNDPEHRTLAIGHWRTKNQALSDPQIAPPK